MNGAESLVQSLAASGVDVCFMNPGTSEMHMVTAIDKSGLMRPILALFEGVATGAADGYARMAGKPAASLLHLGAGLGNGIANLHNAKRAMTPIVNLVGEHATYHRHLDAPLAADIEGLARPVSSWVRTSMSADEIASDAADAVTAALTPPGGVATLIVPADVSWSEAHGTAQPAVRPVRKPPPPENIEMAARALHSAKNAALFIGADALREAGLEAAGRIAQATGAQIICDTFTARLRRGAGQVKLRRLPYFPELVIKALTGTDHLILAGSKPPVAFFAYPDIPNELTPGDCELHMLSSPEEDSIQALEALADALDAHKPTAERQERVVTDLHSGDLTPAGVGAALNQFMPEGAVLMDEALTNSAYIQGLTHGAVPHEHLCLTGGSIGQGLPAATGAAVACPDRKVICPHGDGGAMYTLQALWTQAREKLDVTTVILANRSYAILNVELMRLGAENPGPNALNMLDLHNPELDWVSLAQGMGVEATRAETAEAFNDQFADAMAGRGPRLIEAVI